MADLQNVGDATVTGGQQADARESAEVPPVTWADVTAAREAHATAIDERLQARVSGGLVVSGSPEAIAQRQSVIAAREAKAEFLRKQAEDKLEQYREQGRTREVRAAHALAQTNTELARQQLELTRQTARLNTRLAWIVALSAIATVLQAIAAWKGVK